VWMSESKLGNGRYLTYANEMECCFAHFCYSLLSSIVYIFLPLDCPNLLRKMVAVLKKGGMAGS
jgi:hypothetical protein